MNKTWIALSLTALLPAVAQASEAELLEKINKLAAQVESLRAELADGERQARRYLEELSTSLPTTR